MIEVNGLLLLQRCLTLNWIGEILLDEMVDEKMDGKMNVDISIKFS